mmetsp:Transcript_12065/g.20349  ORF Transcript_12065/g.20349 Transcript_12065/m.20349 type:complete len:343 (+) Transcript_12065:314-1342(+)
MIGRVLRRNRVCVPVVNVRNNIFMVGPQKVNVEQRQSLVMVKPIGGGGTSAGQEQLESYLSKNGPKFERQLAQMVMLNQQSLEDIMESLIRGEKIRKTVCYPMASAQTTHAKILPASFNVVKKVSLKLDPNNKFVFNQREPPTAATPQSQVAPLDPGLRNPRGASPAHPSRAAPLREPSQSEADLSIGFGKSVQQVNPQLIQNDLVRQAQNHSDLNKQANPLRFQEPESGKFSFVDQRPQRMISPYKRAPGQLRSDLDQKQGGPGAGPRFGYYAPKSPSRINEFKSNSKSPEHKRPSHFLNQPAPFTQDGPLDPKQTYYNVSAAEQPPNLRFSAPAEAQNQQ